MGELAEALAAWVDRRTPALVAQVYTALVDGELLLPVRARVVSERVMPSGLHAENEAELDLVAVDLSGGRRVLPAFTDADLMRRWRLDARPVRSAVRDACRAVVDEGWTGLVLDPGTYDFVLTTSAVRALADGFVPVAGDEGVWVGERAGTALVPEASVEATPELVAALRRALVREPVVGEAWLLGPGPEVGLVLRVPVGAAGLATVAQRVGARLAGLPGADRLALAALDPTTAAAVARRGLRLFP